MGVGYVCGGGCGGVGVKAELINIRHFSGMKREKGEWTAEGERRERDRKREPKCNSSALFSSPCPLFLPSLFGLSRVAILVFPFQI